MWGGECALRVTGNPSPSSLILGRGRWTPRVGLSGRLPSSAAISKNLLPFLSFSVFAFRHPEGRLDTWSKEKKISKGPSAVKQ
jgi:hypothetical protein